MGYNQLGLLLAVTLATSQAHAQYLPPGGGSHSPDSNLAEHVFVGSPSAQSTDGVGAPKDAGGAVDSVTREFTFEIPDGFTIKDLKLDLSLSGYNVNNTDIILFRSGTGSPNQQHRMRLVFYGCDYDNSEHPSQISRTEAVTFGWRDVAAKGFPIASVPYGSDTTTPDDWNNPVSNPYVGWAAHNPAEGKYSFAYGVSQDVSDVCQMIDPSEVEGSWLSLPEGTYGIQKFSGKFGNQEGVDVPNWEALIDSSTRKDGSGIWTLRIANYRTIPLPNDPTRENWVFTQSNPILYIYSEDRLSAPQIELPPFVQPDVPFEAKITFPEDVTGMEQADLIVSGGTITGFKAVSATEYVATILPEVDAQTVMLELPEGAAQYDGEGGDSLFASASVGINSSVRTEAIIKNYMARRADIIVSNEPSLTERLLKREAQDKPVSGSFALSHDSSSFNMTTAPVSYGRLDFWTKTMWDSREDDLAKNTSFLAYLGVDTLIREHTVIGVLGQLDYVEEVSNTNKYNQSTSGWEVDGWGYLVGPYIVSRIHDDLIFDARVAYGQSRNTISPYGPEYYEDEFETTRWLARAQLTGEFEMGRFTVAPAVRWTYFSDESESYVDSRGDDIASQEVSLGRLTFGPTISTTFGSDSDRIFKPFFGIHGIWDYDRNDYVDLVTGKPIGDSSDDVRASVNAGVTMTDKAGADLKLSLHYDGLGADDLESYGGSVKFVMPLR